MPTAAVARQPSALEIGAVAVASAACHSALERVPDHAIQGLLTMCGAVSSDGFDFRIWVHSLLAGVGAAAFIVYEIATEDIIEPERSVLCLGPSSTMAWVLPASELGYAVHDLRDALRTGKASFILHGIFVGGFLTLTFALGIAHHSACVLSLHLSSIFLNLRRVDFGPRGNRIVDVMFVISFALLRLLMLPLLWAVFLWHVLVTSDPRTWGACMLGGRVVPAAMIGGLVLHGLNFYWGWLIVKKVLSGASKRDKDGVSNDPDEGHQATVMNQLKER